MTQDDYDDRDCDDDDFDDRNNDSYDPHIPLNCVSFLKNMTI